MNDLELAEEIERKGLLFVLNRLPICDLDGVAKQIIAALRRGPEQDDKEIGEFQQRVYELCEKFYPEVDGAGSDTGDWRDFTFAEIRQTLNHLAEHPPSGEMVEAYRKYRNATNAANYDAFVRAAFKSAAEAEGRKG